MIALNNKKQLRSGRVENQFFDDNLFSWIGKLDFCKEQEGESKLRFKSKCRLWHNASFSDVNLLKENQYFKTFYEVSLLTI